MLANYFTSDKRLQAGQKGHCSHPPTPPRQDAHNTEQGRDAKNNEAHGAMKKERHVCARRRVGEPAVSCENAAGGLFQQPASTLALH
jgi:hypothetical protein